MALWEETFDGEHGKEQKTRNVEDQRSVHTFILSTFPNPSLYPSFFPSLSFFFFFCRGTHGPLSNLLRGYYGALVFCMYVQLSHRLEVSLNSL